MTEMCDRNLAIFEERLAGETFRVIAERHQISVERSRLIFARECRRRGVTESFKRRSPRAI